MEDRDMPVGINPIILNDKNEILLGRRINRYGEGTYCLPGGKLKTGETFEECVVREVKEETGLDIEIKDIKIINLCLHGFVQVGAFVEKYKGVPTICEPNKCDDLRFFDLNNLPSLFEPNRKNIELFKDNKFYE